MTRLTSAVRLELTLQYRQKFLHAGVFSGLIWLAVLLPMPLSLRPVAEPYVLVGDISIIGFFFIGGSCSSRSRSARSARSSRPRCGSGSTWSRN